MESNTCSLPEAEAADVDAVAEAELAALLDAVAEMERSAAAAAVSLAGRVAASGAAERLHGLPVDLLLAADAGLTGGDRHMLITAGQVLATMPGLALAHREGRVSWGQVRAVVVALRRRSLADRALIDARIADTLADLDCHLDPDDLVEAVAAAAILGAVAARQGRPLADDPDRQPHIPTNQQGSAAQTLADVCSQWLAGEPSDGGPDTGGGPDGGGPGGGGPGDGPGGGPSGGGSSRRRARPAYVVDLDADSLDATQPGRLRLRLHGPRPRVSAKRVAADAAAGADVRVVLTRGGVPQSVTGRVRTDADTLDVDGARDHAAALGVPRAHGGDHHPDRLALLCRRHHRLVHDHGWQLTRDPTTGTLTGGAAPARGAPNPAAAPSPHQHHHGHHQLTRRPATTHGPPIPTCPSNPLQAPPSEHPPRCAASPCSPVAALDSAVAWVRGGGRGARRPGPRHPPPGR